MLGTHNICCYKIVKLWMLLKLLHRKVFPLCSQEQIPTRLHMPKQKHAETFIKMHAAARKAGHRLPNFSAKFFNLLLKFSL